MHVDASRLHGLGFVLKQRQDDNSWRMVRTGSRYLSETESRYAMIEIEMLGIAWAIGKCRVFLEGLPHFEIVTEHRPLITILNKYHIVEIENPRLQRLGMSILMYNFTATWRRSKDRLAPDALSRAPVSIPEREDELAEQDTAFYSRVIRAAAEPDEDIRIAELRQVAENDNTYLELRTLIQEGFPKDKQDLPLNMRPFWSVRDRLTLDETELVLYGCRLFIPQPMRRGILQTLHASLQGIERTK